MILKSTNLLLNEKLKKSLGYTRSKFNIAINEPNSAVCCRTKTLEAKKNYVTGFGEGWGLGWLYVDGKYAQTGKLFPIGSFGHCVIRVRQCFSAVKKICMLLSLRTLQDF